MQDRTRMVDRILDWPGALRMALVAAVLLLPVALGIKLAIEPRSQAVREARESLLSKQDALAAGELRVSSYAHLRRQGQVRKQFKTRFEEWLPEGERIPEALAVAALAARAAGAVDLSFDRLTPEKQSSSSPETGAAKEVVSAAVLEVPVRIETRVTLRAAGIFSDTLLGAPRCSRLDELRIASLPPEMLAKLGPGDPARLSMLVRLTLFSRIPGKS